MEFCLYAAKLLWLANQYCCALGALDRLGNVANILLRGVRDSAQRDGVVCGQTRGSLLTHPLKDFASVADNGAFCMPNSAAMEPKACASFLHLFEVYVDDFIQLAQTLDAAALCHCS